MNDIRKRVVFSACFDVGRESEARLYSKGISSKLGSTATNSHIMNQSYEFVDKEICNYVARVIYILGITFRFRCVTTAVTVVIGLTTNRKTFLCTGLFSQQYIFFHLFSKYLPTLFIFSRAKFKLG